MLLSDVKMSIARRMSQSYSLPKSDDELSMYIYEALCYVAAQCEPSVLMQKYDGEDVEVLRDMPDNFCIIKPEYPDFSEIDRHLNIDEGKLCFAVIYATCFILSGEAKFDTICNRWISIFRKNQLNAYACEEMEDDNTGI